MKEINQGNRGNEFSNNPSFRGVVVEINPPFGVSFRFPQTVQKEFSCGYNAPAAAIFCGFRGLIHARAKTFSQVLTGSLNKAGGGGIGVVISEMTDVNLVQSNIQTMRSMGETKTGRRYEGLYGGLPNCTGPSRHPLPRGHFQISRKKCATK